MRYTISKIVLASILALSLTMAGFGLEAARANTVEGRIQESIKALKEMSTQEDAGTMGDLLAQAKGVVIFPSVIKAGIVFGGQYGEGLVLRRDPATKAWYGPSFVTMAGASWGLQIGAQSIALVLVITNDQNLLAA